MRKSLFIWLVVLQAFIGVGAVAGGPDTYQAFLDSLRSPVMVLILWLSTVVMFYHAVAWFSVTPKAMPIQRGEEFVPASIIAQVVSELVDTEIFSRLYRRLRDVGASLVSNVFGLLVDSRYFYGL